MKVGGFMLFLLNIILCFVLIFYLRDYKDHIKKITIIFLYFLIVIGYYNIPVSISEDYFLSSNYELELESYTRVHLIMEDALVLVDALEDVKMVRRKNPLQWHGDFTCIRFNDKNQGYKGELILNKGNLYWSNNKHYYKLKSSDEVIALIKKYQADYHDEFVKNRNTEAFDLKIKLESKSDNYSTYSVEAVSVNENYEATYMYNMIKTKNGSSTGTIHLEPYTEVYKGTFSVPEGQDLGKVYLYLQGECQVGDEKQFFEVGYKVSLFLIN